MMSNNEKKTVFTIRKKNNNKQMDLLRVHVYEYSIKFDESVSVAIEEMPELKEEIQTLNYLWEEKKITEREILTVVMHLMGKYNSYLENFYFKNEELDENGTYIDKELMRDMEFDSNPIEDRIFFYDYFKEQKQLKKIAKKAFEKEIPENMVDEYVEKYVYKGASFYKGVLEEDKFTSTWYFMVVENQAIMAFEKITK